eukprot:gene25859-biopygen21028
MPCTSPGLPQSSRTIAPGSPGTPALCPVHFTLSPHPQWQRFQGGGTLSRAECRVSRALRSRPRRSRRGSGYLTVSCVCWARLAFTLHFQRHITDTPTFGGNTHKSLIGATLRRS